MSLFQRGTFKLHSGAASDFKIDCDALTDDDIHTLALLVSKTFNFSRVIGIPRGGLRLAAALAPLHNADSHVTLIVDDVLTTGGSMERAYVPGAIGVVIFARGKCPAWITPIFQMWDQP